MQLATFVKGKKKPAGFAQQNSVKFRNWRDGVLRRLYPCHSSCHYSKD